MTAPSSNRKRVGVGRLLLVVFATSLIAVAGALTLVYVKGYITPQNQTTSSNGLSGNVVISLGQTPRMLGPGTTMNYTLTLFSGSSVVGNASLSAATSQELSTTLNPAKLTFTGNDVAVDVSIHASDSITPGDYKVDFRVVWPAGSSNMTFVFAVVQHLVLLLGGSTGPGGFHPLSQSIHRGESVTWLSLDAGSDEYGGLRSIKVVETGAASPTLTLFTKWSYTFAEAGTYHVDDPLNSILVAEGTVIVA